MKSLILKDLYNIFHNLKSLALMLLVFLFIFLPSSGLESYIFFSCFLCSIIIITTFSFDDMSNWTKYALIMPISRKELVLSKFIISFIFSAFGAVSGLVLAAVAAVVTHKISLNNLENLTVYLVMAGIGLFINLLFDGLSIPLLFKYGAEKARMLTFVAYVLPVCIIMGVYKLLEFLGVVFTDAVIIGILWSLPVTAIVWNYIMYQISCKIFERKELIG